MNNLEEVMKVPAPVFDVFNVYFNRVYEPTMHIIFELDRRIDEICLKSATIKAIISDPYLLSRYTEKDDVAFWEMMPLKNFDEAFYVLEISGSNEVIFTNPPSALDVYKGPQVRVGIYRCDNGDTVVVTCHHGFTDAHGLSDLSAEIFSIYRNLQDNPEYEPEFKGWYNRGTADILERFSASKIRGTLDNEEPFIDRWAFPPVSYGQGIPRIAVRKFPPDRLKRIKEFGKEYGATVNDIMIGAFFLALLKINSCESYENSKKSILTSADIRKYYGREKDTHPQNLSIAYEMSLKAEKTSKLKDIISQITKITKEKKSGDLGLGCIAFYEEIFSGGLNNVRDFYDSMMAGYNKTNYKNPVFSNTGIINPEDFLPVEDTGNKNPVIKYAVFLPTICWPPGFLMTVSTFKDSITILSGYEEGPYSKDTVEKFLKYVADYLP